MSVFCAPATGIYIVRLANFMDLNSCLTYIPGVSEMLGPVHIPARKTWPFRSTGMCASAARTWQPCAEFPGWAKTCGCTVGGVDKILALAPVIR